MSRKRFAAYAVATGLLLVPMSWPLTDASATHRSNCADDFDNDNDGATDSGDSECGSTGDKHEGNTCDGTLFPDGGNEDGTVSGTIHGPVEEEAWKAGLRAVPFVRLEDRLHDTGCLAAFAGQ